MTTTVAILALGVALAALALVGAAGAIAIRRADKAGEERAARAAADGRVEAAGVEVERAHDAIAEADAARQRQQIRADALEEELSHAEVYPVLPGDAVDRPGRARLRAHLSAAAGLRAARADGGSGPAALPDAAAPGDAAGGGVAGGGGRPADA